jgi:hypothetical protein
MYDPGFRNVRFVHTVRPYYSSFERECDPYHKNTLQILASNPPKCQPPLLCLKYKESKKVLLKKGVR